MSKKVVEILTKEIEACESKMREILKERADLVAAVELFDNSIKFESITIITGNIPKKKVAVETVATGDKANMIMRKKPNKDRTRTAVSASVLFADRVPYSSSKRIVTRSLLDHLIKLGYLESKGKGQYTVAVGGKRFMVAYQGAGVKFYTDTFDLLIEEVGFKYTKKKSGMEVSL